MKVKNKYGKVYEYEQIKWVVSPDLNIKFREIAKSRDIPLSQLITEIVSEWIEKEENNK